MKLAATYALALLALPLNACSAQEPPPASSARALLVGVSEYPRLKAWYESKGDIGHYRNNVALLGPDNDVLLMRDTLREVLGFPKHGIRILSTGGDGPEPTLERILAELDRLAEEAQPGEFVVVYLSGHGAQQPDRDGDERDGLDEIFLPSDVDRWEMGTGSAVPGALVDDDLSDKLEAVRAAGARVWLLVDACHSGTLLRGEDLEVRYRSLAGEDLGIPEDAVRRATGGLPDDETIEYTSGASSGLVAMYGARSHETAPEMRLPGKAHDRGEHHGLFTFTMVQQLRRTHGLLSFDELLQRMDVAYGAVPWFACRPSGQGELVRMIRDGAESGKRMQLGLEDGALVVDAGQLNLIEAGTVLAVYPAGRRGEPDASLGRVRVTAVELNRSLCERVVGEPGEAAMELEESELYPVEVVESPVSPRRLKVAILDGGAPGDERTRDIRSGLGECSTRVLVVEPAEADWILDPAEPMTLFSAREGRQRRFAVESGDAVGLLLRIFKAENLMSLAAHPQAGGLPAGLDVALCMQEDDVEPRPLRRGEPVRPGTGAVLRIHNQTGEEWALWAFVIDQEYGIQGIFPRWKRGQEPDLGPEPIPRGGLIFTDEDLGLGHVLLVAVEPGSGHLGWLEQNPQERQRSGRARGDDAGGAIGGLLDVLANGESPGGQTRSLSVAADLRAAVGLIDFDVGWGEVEIDRPMGEGSARLARAEDLLPRPPEQEEPWEPGRIEARPKGPEPERLYSLRAPAVFAVRTGAGFGTGVLIDSEGLVLTNHHVVAEGYSYSKRGRRLVHLLGGTLDGDGVMEVAGGLLSAEIVSTDPARDLALLRILDPPAWLEGVEPVPLREEPPSPGEACTMLGHPSCGLMWSLRPGVVSAIGSLPQDVTDPVLLGIGPDFYGEELSKLLAGQPPLEIVQSTCLANPGDSGGPLLDGEGRLLGVTCAGPEDASLDNFTFHVHVDEVAAFLAEVAALLAEVPPGEERGPDVPDPWKLGPNAKLASTAGPGGVNDLLVGGEDRWETVLVDLDDDTRVPTGVDSDLIREMVSSTSFDAEIALRIDEHQRVAFYDTNNDGSFDLILVDYEGDSKADISFRLENDAWRVDAETQQEWLQIHHLEYLRGMVNRLDHDNALKKVRALLG